MSFGPYGVVSVLGRTVGPSRGLMDTGRYGVSPMSVPPGFMPTARNLLFTAAGGFEARPGAKCHALISTVATPPTLLKIVPTSSTVAYWVYALGTNVYAELVSETRISGPTAAASGATRVATCGTLARVSGDIALVMTHTNGSTPPWYLRLPAKTAGNLAATGGLPAAVQYAKVCATAGNRLWLADGCTIHYSIPNPDLTLGTSWDVNDYITPGIVGNPADNIVGMFEFGDWLVAMSSRRAYMVPLDNPQSYTTALDYAGGKAQEYGLVNVNAFAIGDGQVFFCTGRDFMAWSPGIDAPRSLTKTDGLATVAGRFLDPTNDFSACAVGFDATRRVVLFSYAKDSATDNNHTLAFDLDRQAWCDWTLGTNVFGHDETPQTLDGKRLWLSVNTEDGSCPRAPYTLDRDKAADETGLQDVDPTTGVDLQPVSLVPINMAFSTHQYSEENRDLQVKTVRVLVDASPQDGVPLSRGVLTCSTYADGDNLVDWQQQNVGDPHAATEGDATEGDAAAASQLQSIIFSPDTHAAQGRSLSFVFKKGDGLPIRVLGAEALVRSRREGMVYA